MGLDIHPRPVRRKRSIRPNFNIEGQDNFAMIKSCSKPSGLQPLLEVPAYLGKVGTHISKLPVRPFGYLSTNSIHAIILNTATEETQLSAAYYPKSAIRALLRIGSLLAFINKAHRHPPRGAAPSRCRCTYIFLPHRPDLSLKVGCNLVNRTKYNPAICVAFLFSVCVNPGVKKKRPSPLLN